MDKQETSVFYQLNVGKYELLAADRNGSSLFLQKDTTFAFRCLYDSCGTNRLIAYCDSTGVVERFVLKNQVINILYHQDNKKIDLFYKDKEGKMKWLKDIENPYASLPARSVSRNVPYSAIKVINDMSYAIYKIIDSYPIELQFKQWLFVKNFSAPPLNDEMALELIANELGKEYDVEVSEYYSMIASVMNDYSTWVIEELYGDAVPWLRTYAERGQNNIMKVTAFIDKVDSTKTEYRVGALVQERGKTISNNSNLGNEFAVYKSNKADYTFSFSGLVTGKSYKFRPYLAPVDTSKYLSGMKCLVDYYKYGISKDYLLLETKANLKSQEDDEAIVSLSVEMPEGKNFKMGVVYGKHSKLLENEYSKVEYEITFPEITFSEKFEREAKMEKLESGYTYYMPYIIYDDHILNRTLKDTTSVIYEQDKIFYGKKDSIYVVRNPITRDAVLKDNQLIFTGSFDMNIEGVTEYGICYSKDVKEFTLEDSSVLKADKHNEGGFEVSMSDYEEEETFYYRAYVKVGDNIYYGNLKEFTTPEEMRLKVYHLTKMEKWEESYYDTMVLTGKKALEIEQNVYIVNRFYFDERLNTYLPNGRYWYNGSSVLIWRDTVYKGEGKWQSWEWGEKYQNSHSIAAETDSYISLFDQYIYYDEGGQKGYRIVNYQGRASRIYDADLVKKIKRSIKEFDAEDD